MKLLIVRHEQAGDREEFAKIQANDELRPLTEDGLRRIERNAAVLTQLIDRLDVIYTSPLLRARQTAESLHSHFEGVPLFEAGELKPLVSPKETLQLIAQEKSDWVALVGHEPHLSALIGYLLTGASMPLSEVKKGSMTLLEFSETPQKGQAQLIWSIPARFLKRISK